MVLLADNTFANCLLQKLIQHPNPYNIRIWSLYKIYKHTDICMFWVQYKEKEAVSFIAKSGTGFILDVSEHTDLEELCAFLKMAGFSSLLYDAACTLPEPGLKKNAMVMRFEKNKPYGNRAPLQFVTPELKEVYTLLKACESADFPVPPFEEFYLEMSHRLRHDGAKAVGIEESGRLLACALAVFKTPYGAVIGCVATHPQHRRKGLAGALVTYLTSQLQQENIHAVFLHTARQQTQAFYERLGFTVCGFSSEVTV